MAVLDRSQQIDLGRNDLIVRSVIINNQPGQSAAGAMGQIFNSVQDNLTAHAGGGQASGTPITAMSARFTVVATAADSGTLPVSVAGMELTVINATATNAMNVFPAVGDTINALGANTAFSLAAGKTMMAFCVTAGQWHTILSA